MSAAVQPTPTTPSSAPITSPGPRRPSAPSPPVDPSKLNNTPVTLPSAAEGASSSSSSSAAAQVDPMLSDSAYLAENSGPVEPPSHPTVAETGMFHPLGLPHECGPHSGQLKRRESDVNREIIRLSSFGGEGLKVKPPRPVEQAVEEE